MMEKTLVFGGRRTGVQILLQYDILAKSLDVLASVSSYDIVREGKINICKMPTTNGRNSINDNSLLLNSTGALVKSKRVVRKKRPAVWTPVQGGGRSLLLRFF